MMAASTSKQPPPTGEQGGATTTTTISAIPPEIMESNILNRLDGGSLASASCASRLLRRLSSHPHLWSRLSLSTWPSLSTSPLLLHLISTAGPRSFFSDCSLLLPCLSPPPPQPPAAAAMELISAVDIRHGDTLVFSRVKETNTETGWFRCSPFLIDMLDDDPKESVRTPVSDDDGSCESLYGGLRLSWIVADPARGRAADLSTGRAVSVRRHWLSGEVEARFAAVLGGEKKKGPTEYVEFRIVVTCAGVVGEGMHVREVSLRAEDMDGKEVSGRDGMVILRRALEGKRVKGDREEEGRRRRYEEYLERKRERKDRRVRAERRLDDICVTVGASILAAFCFYFLCS